MQHKHKNNNSVPYAALLASNSVIYQSDESFRSSIQFVSIRRRKCKARIQRVVRTTKRTTEVCNKGEIPIDSVEAERYGDAGQVP